MKVYFIVKPIGAHAVKQLRKSIEATFDKKRDNIHIFNTLKKGHAIDLTQKAIEEKADLVVACGGDGTVNEVARGLVETEIPLAIVPLGSGNGIARHFKIPLGISKAVQLIKKNKIAKMDVGVVNGHYFFGNMGCALNHILSGITRIKDGMESGPMSLLFDAVLSFRHQKIKIEYQKEMRQISPFVLLVSNTNQQGYNFSLTPQALSDDGYMDLFWMEKSNVLNKTKFFIYVLLRKKLTANTFNLIRLSTLRITLLDQDEFCVQVDGESLPLASNHLEVSVLPKKLNIIVS